MNGDIDLYRLYTTYGKKSRGTKKRSLYKLCLIKKLSGSDMVKVINEPIYTIHLKKSLSCYPLLLQSNKLIDQKIGQQLVKLIKRLQENPYNYRDQQQPKLQEIVCQYQHYRQYKQLKELMNRHKIDIQQREYSPNSLYYDSDSSDSTDSSDSDIESGLLIKTNPINTNKPHTNTMQNKVCDDVRCGIYDDQIPISLTPSIFSMKEYKFMTEINGLLYRNNIALYALIENIFIKFIPMFNDLLNMKLLNNEQYKQLSVIVKIQDYQFENVCNYSGDWHCEGNENDNIIAVGLYYFDITENEQLRFDINELEFVEEENWKSNKGTRFGATSSVKTQHNDCIVFKNSIHIKHRAKMVTKSKFDNFYNKSKQYLSRKFLSFFLLDPDNENIAGHKEKDFKWINFSEKIDVICKYYLEYDDNIPLDIMQLISIFTFGDEKYKKEQRIQFRKNLGSKQHGSYEPFYDPMLSIMGLLN